MEHTLGKSDGTTLMKHIEDCLGVYSQLRNTLPYLPVVTNLNNFWELLFYIIYFHDWGKCHNEFQKVLKGLKQNFWNYQRHEIYSVPFVDKLDLNDEEKLLIQRAIIGHHKNYEIIHWGIVIEKPDDKNLWNPLVISKWHCFREGGSC